MKLMRMGLALAVCWLGLSASTARADVVIDFDTYAAVAFSTETGKYGYAWNYGSRAAAERAALAKCKADDAKIVGWVKGGWLVLVVGDNNAYGVAWEYGDGARSSVAKRRALDELKKRKGKAVALICLCSGDYDPEVVR